MTTDAAIRTNYIFVDYENVQEVDLECIWSVTPRVAPWAITLRLVGASNRGNPSFPAPTGRYVIAQGNALGMARKTKFPSPERA